MTKAYDEWEYDDRTEIEAEVEPVRQRRLASHRGVLILVLGILGLVVCQFLGIVAWVMGNSDLDEMRAGRMDPSGMDLTQAGRVCGIIATVLLIVSVGFVFLFLLVGGVSTAL